MSLERINTWLALIANVGVVAGIIFLVIEIGQNTRALNATALNDVQEDVLELVTNDPELVALTIEISDKVRNGDDVSAFESEMYARGFFRAMRIHEGHWYQFDSGLLDVDLYNAYKVHWLATAYFYEQIYQSLKETMLENGAFHPGFAEEFVNHIDNSPPFAPVRL